MESLYVLQENRQRKEHEARMEARRLQKEAEAQSKTTGDCQGLCVICL